MLELIAAAAARWPERVAIEEADAAPVTYAQLIARAEAFATALRARGAARVIVELVATRSADFVARCLGAWIARCAWFPIDRGEPHARVAAMRERLARAARLARIEADDVVLAAGDRSGAVTGGDDHADLAYAIATSGSTGAPKIVLVAHRGLRALIEAQVAAFQLGAGDRALWLHAPIFDASISDWGTVLAAGATLVIPRDGATHAIARELADRAITHVDLPPAQLAQLDPSPPRPLRVVVLGGEPCPVERVRALARLARVVVVYGPTEATVCSSLVVVDPDTWTRPLIGDPLPGVGYRVVDGELYITGDGLAVGYAGDLDETARRFVVLDGVRAYRTGDRIEAVAGGLAFVGRVDRQRKLRGRRVELGEIEAALRVLPGVADAAVAVTPREHLVAVVEPAPGGDGDRPLDARSLRARLGAALPAWLIPSRIVVAALPRGATGKVDPAALAEVVRGRPRMPSPAVGDALAAELAALWCEVLEVDDVEPADRFSDAGGDSLAAVALLAAAATRAISLDPAALADDPSFAVVVERARARAVASPVTVAVCEARGLARARAIAGALPERRAASSPATPAGRTADRDESGAIRACRPSPRVALITGATGLLGRHLVRAWRERSDRPLVALVRTPDQGLDVDPIVGDLGRPRLGLADAVWEDLAARVDTVIHGGAALQLAGDWDAHVAVNVDGTAEVVALARAAGAALHHISTLAVFVATDRARGRHAPEHVPAPGAAVFGGYAQTKVAAEAIARDAGATIVRLGLLVDDRPGPTTQLGMVIRGLRALGAVPRGAGDDDLRFDLTPVAHAARAIVALALDAATGAHHVAGRAASYAELRAALALPELPAGAWADRARGRIADPDIALAYLALARVHGDAALRARAAAFDLFLATGANFASPPLRAFEVRW